MMRKVVQMLVPVLIMVLLSIATSQADPKPEAQTDIFLRPWNPRIPIEQDIRKCWSAIESVQGCQLEIFTSILKGHIYLGPACCKTINELSENCFPKMFSFGWVWGLPPFNPLFPPLVKNYCASIGGLSSPPPPPPPVVGSAPPPSPTAQGVAPPPTTGLAPDQGIPLL